MGISLTEFDTLTNRRINMIVEEQSKFLRADQEELHRMQKESERNEK